ncbi:MAG: DUF302 domain-containing protein [Planctomycetales bacterium]|nr:DUF302 domain-containing protein [bacterium]UNM07714.1 MAG: DUF302 domain-containing protein [Planctomycetales bacterium]
MKTLWTLVALFLVLSASAFAQEDGNMNDEAASMHSHITVNGYYLHTAVSTDFETTVEKLRGILKDEGFGVLTEIDFSAKMKEKLDVDTPPCLILGACNPPFAWQVFQSEPWIGVEMPCNVVVRQMDDGSVEVAIKNPGMLVEATGNNELSQLGEDLTQAVVRILEKVSH